MSGTIDDNGVQWERCCGCQEWVKLGDLGYLKPTAKHKHGLDLCVTCVDTALRCRSIRFSQVLPAASWKQVRV